MSTVTHHTSSTTAALSSAALKQTGIAAVPTPRIDSLLASRHRRQQQQRELVQALHVDHRLELIERKLATFNSRTPTSSTDHRFSSSKATRSVAEDDGSDDTENRGERAGDTERVLKPGHRGESVKRKQPGATQSAQTQTEPSDVTDTATQSSHLPSYQQLQEQMLQLQAELSAAREQGLTERAAMEARQLGLEEKLGEVEGQLQSRVSAAVERMTERDEHQLETRRWRDECTNLSKQHHQALEESKQREAEAHAEADKERKLYTESARRWQDQLEQLQRQLNHTQVEEARMQLERDRAEAEVRRMQVDKERLESEVRQQEQREQRLTTDVAALSQQVKQLQSQLSESQTQTRQAKEAETVAADRLARDRLLWEQDRRQLCDKLTDVELRLTALSSHYVDKQRDVSDLKELIKLSVRNEREARREADEAREEVRRRDEQLSDVQRRCQHERSEWQEERETVRQQLQAYQLEQQAASDSRSKVLSAHTELDELKKQATKSAKCMPHTQHPLCIQHR